MNLIFSLYQSYNKAIKTDEIFKEINERLLEELDYVRDILDPAETFDPNSAISICRAVKRFLKVIDKKTDIVNPEEFINKIVNYGT